MSRILLGATLLSIALWLLLSADSLEDELKEIEVKNATSQSLPRWQSSPKFLPDNNRAQHLRKAAIKVTLQLRDKLSGNPLPNCKIDVGLISQKTDAFGSATFSCDRMGLKTEAIITLDRSFGKRKPIHASFTCPESDPEFRTELEVSAYSGVDVVGDESTISEFLIEVHSAPLVEEILNLHPDLSDREKEALQMSAADADSYAQNLNALYGYTWPSTRSEFVGCSGTVLTKCTGRATIQIVPRSSVSGEYLAMQSVNQKLIAGESYRIVIDTMGKPVVSGIVIDDQGTPVAGAMVTVACRWLFGESNKVPRLNSEPGGTGIVVWKEHGIAGIHARVYLSRVSDEDGRFRIPMPFTGETAVWATKFGFYSGYLRTSALGVSASHGDLAIRIQAARKIPSATTRFVYKDGTPAAGESVVLKCVDPPHYFNRSYLFTTDKNGMIDSSELDLGVEFAGLVSKSPIGLFRHQTRNEIELLKRKKRRRRK